MQLISKIREFFPRGEERFPTFASVEIMTESGALIAKATLRDISKSGGFLRIDESAVLPEQFVIWIPKLCRAVESSVKWRSTGNIGVRFDQQVDLEVFRAHRENRAQKVAKYFAVAKAA